MSDKTAASQSPPGSIVNSPIISFGGPNGHSVILEADEESGQSVPTLTIDTVNLASVSRDSTPDETPRSKFYLGAETPSRSSSVTSGLGKESQSSKSGMSSQRSGLKRAFSLSRIFQRSTSETKLRTVCGAKDEGSHESAKVVYDIPRSSPSKPSPPPVTRRTSSLVDHRSFLKVAGSTQTFPLHEGVTRAAELGSGHKVRGLRGSVTMPSVVSMPLPSLHEYVDRSLTNHKVGDGATAIVRRVTLKKHMGGGMAALKEFRKKAKGESDQEYIQKILSEFYLCTQLNHPNIIKMVALCKSDHSIRENRFCEIMEYCSGGDLFSIIKSGIMNDEDKWCCWKQLLRGVRYLHSKGIAHRDLKPENLLMTEDGHLKITDFGVSDHVGRPGSAEYKITGGLSHGVSGSTPYLPPEVLAVEKAPYDPFKVDVWSSACIYYVLFHMGLPWERASSQDPLFQKYLDALADFERKSDLAELTSQMDIKLDEHEGNKRKDGEADFLFSTLSPASSTDGKLSSSAPTPEIFKKSNGGSAGPASRMSSRVSSASRPSMVRVDPISPIASRTLLIEGQTPKYRAFKSHDTASRKMLFRLFDPNPARRPDIEQVMSIGMVKSIKCCCLDLDEEEKLKECHENKTLDASSKRGLKGVTVQAKHSHVLNRK